MDLAFHRRHNGTRASTRAKNMMAVIQAIVNRSADKQFSEGFTVRLQALAANQDLLVRRNWTGARIGALISSQLAGVADLIGSKIHLDGDMDPVLLSAAAETIGLAIHELATNALKYGAISSETGEITVSGGGRGEWICRGEAAAELDRDRRPTLYSPVSPRVRYNDVRA